MKGIDLEPWDDGFFGLLQADDYPTGDPDDDLIQGEDDLLPAARRCPKAVRRLIRNARWNLGHPSNFSLVRVMSVAKRHPDMIAYAANMSCPTCQEPATSETKNHFALLTDAVQPGGWH